MKKKYIKLLTIAGVLATLLTSCLKSESNYTDFSKAGTLIELPLSAATGLGKLTIEALPIQTELQNIPVVVNIASPKPLGSAVTVTLGLGVQADVDAYNKANDFTEDDGTAYVLPPTAAYSLSANKVTIAAGQRMGTINLQVNTSLLDPSALYLIPVSITDGGGQQVSNYKTILFSVQAKNKYDGVYTVTGTMSDANAGTNVGLYPLSVYLETQGATLGAMFDPKLNGGFFGHQFTSATGASYYGNFAPIFNFGADNTVTAVTNYWGQGTNSQVRAAQLAPGSTSTAKGTPGSTGFSFTVKYIMTQGGNPRTTFTETWTYTGARP